MGKSDYTYDFLYTDDKHILVLYDQNLGNMSLTNNMENVLQEVEAETGKKLDHHAIIYRDTRGIYDEIRIRNGKISFHPIGESDRDEALKKLLSHY